MSIERPAGSRRLCQLGRTATLREVTMELRDVDTFLVLAEELHFGRTAERLYVTPGRVSQTTRALEREVGGRLIRAVDDVQPVDQDQTVDEVHTAGEVPASEAARRPHR